MAHIIIKNLLICFDMFWWNICTFSPLSTCILFQVYVFNDPPPSNVQVSGTKMTPPSSMRRIGFYQHDIVICIIWYNMFIICIQYIYIYMYTVYIHIINMSLHTCIHMYIYIYIYILIIFTFTQSLPRWPLAAMRCCQACTTRTFISPPVATVQVPAPQLANLLQKSVVNS